MAKTIQFDEFDGAGRQGRGAHCVACEQMLTDALDGSLGEIDQAWFDGHTQSCTMCSAMLADAQRGAAWLELLKDARPEPSAGLLESILAETSGAQGLVGMPVGQAVYTPQMVPARMPLVAEGVPTNLLAFRPRAVGWMFEPRLAMTAAMAFFSLALTLNLAGVKLNDLRASDLKPENLKRGYYETNTQAVRYFDNLRLVRVMESRVDDLRQTQMDDAAQARRHPRPEAAEPEKKPEGPQAKPERGPGMSQDQVPRGLPARPRMNAVEDRLRQDDVAVQAMRKEGGLV